MNYRLICYYHGSINHIIDRNNKPSCPQCFVVNEVKVNSTFVNYILPLLVTRETLAPDYKNMLASCLGDNK